MNIKRMARMGGLALIAAAALSGCAELFGPAPAISDVSANVTSTTSGSEIYVRVQGDTIGNGESIFQDYTATISLSGSGVSATPVTVEGAFNEVIPVVLEPSGTGTVSVTATLTASNGERDFGTVNISVSSSVPNEGTTSNPLRLVMNGAYRTTEIGAAGGSYDDSYYKFTAASSSVVVRIQNLTASSLDHFLYTNSSFSILEDSDTGFGSTALTWTVFGLTPTADYYLRLQTDNGSGEEFDIRIESN